MALVVRALCALAVLGTGCSLEPGAAPTAITVRIEHSRFVPAVLEVKAGESVRFEVVNDDPIDHEFLIGDETVQDLHERGTESHHGARPGEISVPAGASAETTYRFDEPGTLIFGCHLPQHYAYGMRGVIRIEG